MLTALGAFAAGLLAFANGGNDNAKPVATLVAAGLASPRRALILGTAATFVGCAAATFLGGALVGTFSAKGLVGSEVAVTLPFAVSTTLAAGATVLLASRLGLPISTTHALIGAILGSGFVLAHIDGRILLGVFVVPLLASPLVALVATSAVYPVLHRARHALGIERSTCVCVGERWVPAGDVAALQWQVSVSDAADCQDRYVGRVAGVRAGAVAAAFHWLSALGLSLGRGLQDGAKIAALALLLVGAPAGLVIGMGVAFLMAAGGLLAARRVEETMAHRITTMNDGQALVANGVATILVLVATGLGLPVSTTHVTTGSLVGLRRFTTATRTSWLGRILLAWVATLPLAAVLAAGSAALLR